MATEKKETPKKSEASKGEGMKSERGDAPMENQIAPEVASPGGPVPMSALTSDEDDAKRLRKEREKQLEEERNYPKASQEIDEETLEGMSSSERRGLARQRGYETRGRRMSTQQFIALQDDDDGLEEA